MKAKTRLLLILGIFLQFNLFGQFEIGGPTELCNYDCGYYQLYENGNPVNGDYYWDFGNGTTATGGSAEWCPGWIGNSIITVSDANGTIIAEFQFYGTYCCSNISIEGPSELCVGECAEFDVFGGSGGYTFQLSNGEFFTGGFWCPSGAGVYDLIVTDFDGCEGWMSISVNNPEMPEIYSLSGAFCLDDSLSFCDRVCENTTVTYTTEVNNPGLDISWSVSGAESWEENGNEVIVEWGDPGQGQVSVVVGNGAVQGLDWFVTCGSYLMSELNQTTGTGHVTIDGTGTYHINVFGPNGNLFWNLYSNGQNQPVFIENVPPGIYIVEVQDINTGYYQTCEFTIDSVNDLCPPFGFYFDVTPASDQNCCDASIETQFLGSAPEPFTYLWSNGSTTQDLNGLCEGTYGLTVTNDLGCTTNSMVTITCSVPQGCSGTNSLCVDILEIPDAEFETNPPAVNGVVEICEGQTVFFDNLTNGGFNYTWDFGDGVSSSLVDAEHTYLSPGTYEAILIARNDCFCADSSAVTIIVEESITPEIDCAGTICPGEEITYTSNADCSIFYWAVSSNGTIISGGNTSDNFITVDWGAGPEGIIELSVDGCSGDYCVQTLFESIPIIDDNAEIQGPERVCKGAEVIYSMPAFAGTEFIWTVSNFGTITEGQGSNEITVQWANEVTPIQQLITCQYESCYLGCGGYDELAVNILNEVFIEGPIEACPNGMETYTCLTPLGGIVNADWTVYNAIGNVVATSAAPTSSYDINWSFGSGNFTVHADVENPTNYCIDNFSVFVEVVQPTNLPAAIDGTMDVCPGTTYTYTGVSGAGNYDYTWYISDGGSNYVLNGQSVNVMWGPAPPYVLQLTQTNLNGLSCESEAISASPAIINTVSLSGTPALCFEETGTYTATLHENLEYEWQISPADAGTITGEDNLNQVEIQWNTPGTHDVQVTVCGVSSTFAVIVYPPPIPVPVFNTVCPGQTDVVSVTQPYVAYEWKNEFGTTISNNATANLGTGYYEVIVTNNNGCTQNEIFFVPTYGQPDVTISTPDFGNFCQNGGSMILYALESSSGPLDYQWFRNGTPFGTNSSSQTITQEGSYYVMVTDINGCTDFSNTLGLNCVDLPAGPPIPGCTPIGFPAFEIQQGVFCNESQYTNTSVNSVANTWDWEFWDIVGGGISYSSQENPSHTWTNAGFNIVSFTVGIESTVAGQYCLMNTFLFDTIPLAANFVHEGICAGEPVSFEDISTFIPQTNITGWSWNFGDPASGANNTSTLQNPLHIYTNGGFYNVVQTVTDLSGCISQKQFVIEITDPPLASFSIPQQTCEGGSLLFEASGSFTDVTWDFGDPASGEANTSTSSNSYHVYNTPGVFTVTLTVENVYGCIESVTEQVTVEANNLSGNITVNPGLEVCEGDSVILRAPMSDTYSWSTGANTQEITVFDAGEYGVTIYDAIGCGYSPPPVVIDLIPLPQGQITSVEYNEFGEPVNFFYNSYETCYGDDVYLVITENTNYTYQWSDGSVGTEISFTEEKENLLEVGTHEFTVTITDTNTGCTNVVGPFTVTVHPVPENILITSMPAAPVCENTPTVMSVVNPDPSFIYIWNTGQSGTSINTFYAGKYFVRAINQFGCEGESNTLEIVPGPNVDLIPSGCHARCNPDTICLPPVLGVSSFQWYFEGAPIPSPEGNDPDYIATESGEYYVEMISVDGCITISDILTLDLYDGFGSVQGNVYFDINDNGIIDAADTLMSGIGIILQNGGLNIDTLTSNQIGSFAFANILSTNYQLIIDELNLPEGMVAIISQAPAQLVGCDDEEMVEFLIQFNCVNNTGTESLTACNGGTVNYNGTDLSGGTVTDFTFENALGCDSVVTVTVQEAAPITSTLDLETCVGTTINYNGTDLSPGTETDFTLMSTGGCDSTVTVVVAILNESTNTVSLQACAGSTVDYNGNNLVGGSVTDFTYPNALGCDSIVTVTVIESNQDSSSINLQTCVGTTINYNGTALDPDTQTDFMFLGNDGCDSIVTVIVNPFPVFAVTENLEACVGESVLYNGSNLMAGTSTDFTFATADNCDSIVTVVVAELSSSAGNVQLSACQNETVLYNGTALMSGSTTDFTFDNVNGCDSIVTVAVAVLAGSTENVQLSACENGTVQYNGNFLSPGSTTDFTFDNVNGCDSIVTVFVQSLNTSTSTIALDACDGENAMYNGTSIAAGASMDFTFSNVAGCDSVVTVNVAELPLYSFDLELSACEGETTEYNGVDLMAGSITPFVFTSVGGCDSTMTITVETVYESAYTLNVSACEGGAYFYNGQNVPAGGSMDFALTNSNGCDSTVTVNVASLTISETFVDLLVCSGETIEFNGSELIAGFEDTFILTDQNGCDSLVTVTVDAYPDFNFSVVTDAACWNDNNGNVFVENVVGGTAPFQFSIDGINYQDSTTFLNVNSGNISISVVDDNGCEEMLETEITEITALDIVAEIPEIPCDFSPVRIELENMSDNPGVVSYLWNDGSIQPFIDVDTPMVYTVEITNTCETIVKEFSVGLAADARLEYFYVPNIFSPNNDGMNDYWKIMPPDDMEVLAFELHVFDRWGNHLKTFANVQDEWNGSFKGEEMKPGVYVYWYQATVLSCGRTLEVFDKGDVTIVK